MTIKPGRDLLDALRHGDRGAARAQGRLLAQRELTRAACAASRVLVRSWPDRQAYHTLVFGGPLRGCRLAMPALECPAYPRGTYEPHVARTLRTHVRPGDVVYDVGAHIGYLTLLAARLAAAEGHVYAFEAHPRNRALLERNIQMNRAGNVTVVPAAVSDHGGEVEFALFSYSFVGRIVDAETPADGERVRVPALTLDEFLTTGARPPQVLKIDVEGAEARVLAGALKLIEQHRPVIIAEVREGECERVVRAEVLARGYRLQPLRAANRTFEGIPLTDVLLLPEHGR